MKIVVINKDNSDLTALKERLRKTMMRQITQSEAKITATPNEVIETCSSISSGLKHLKGILSYKRDRLLRTRDKKLKEKYQRELDKLNARIQKFKEMITRL